MHIVAQLKQVSKGASITSLRLLVVDWINFH